GRGCGGSWRPYSPRTTNTGGGPNGRSRSWSWSRSAESEAAAAEPGRVASRASVGGHPTLSPPGSRVLVRPGHRGARAVVGGDDAVADRGGPTPSSAGWGARGE